MPSPPFNEDLLQFIWEQQLFRRDALRTAEGKRLEVIKAGRIQQHSGPDLCDARVRIDGQVLAGNIEVHLRSSDWYAHHHETDPAYDNVILHVVWEHDMAVRTARGGRVSDLELRSRVAPLSIEAYQLLMKNRAWVPCEGQIGRVEAQRIHLWLERVLVERLERKTQEVELLFEQLANDRAETFYHLLARALGVKVNAEAFGMLAHALPLKVLLKYRDDALRTEALLFGQAGLLQVDLVDEYPRTLQHEHALLAKLHGLRPAPMAAWKFARMHPPNFPTIRIAQLAQLIAKCEGTFSGLLEQDDPVSLRRELEVGATGYWTDHFRFDQRSAPSQKTFGQAAADHVIINAIVPFRFAMARLKGDEAGMQRTLGLLERIPPEHNTIIERWSQLGLRAANAAQTQGLIELKNQYCGQRRCLSCVIGTDLLKRTAP